MSYEFELDHKKTTILVGVFFALLVLVFIAGWLSGALFGIPKGKSALESETMPKIPPRERPAAAPVKVVVPPAEPEPRFAVQVGAFHSAAQALRQAVSLKEKGYKPYVLKGQNSKGVTWFTVRISDHADHGKAEAAADAFETAEGMTPVVTYLDTLSVVRSGDDSQPPAGSILQKGLRLDLDLLAAESSKASEEAVEVGSQDADGDVVKAGAGADTATTGPVQAADHGDEGLLDDESITDTGSDAVEKPDPGQDGIDDEDAETVFEEDDEVSDSSSDAMDRADSDMTLETDAGEKTVMEGGDAEPFDLKNDSEAFPSQEPEQTAMADDDAQETDADDTAAETVDEKDPISDTQETEKGDMELQQSDSPDGSENKTDRRYSVQVGAFLKEQNAYGLAEKLRTGGHGAYVFDVDDAAGKTWYAVRIDDFEDLKSALAAARKAREEESLPALVTRIDSLDVVAVPGAGPVPAGSDTEALLKKPVYAATAESGSHPYSLRLASYKSREAADHAVAVYRQKGLAAFSIEAKGSGGETFRLVHMGLYDSYDSARAAKEQLNLSGAMIKRTPWANLVGVYGQMADAEAQAARLAEAGISSYLALQSDSAVQVLTGAFSTREQAEAYGESLNENGFHNAVVER